VALFTPDRVFQDICYGLRIEGQVALRAHAQRMKKHNLDLRVDVTTCDATSLTGVAEWRLCHIYAGNFDGVDCTGIPIAICGLSIYHFAAGRIARAADYWDYFELIRALSGAARVTAISCGLSMHIH
jgi:hypothetical protein